MIHTTRTLQARRFQPTSASISGEREEGAALIVALGVLATTLVLGVSGFESAQTEETLTGNFRFATQAQLAAEGAATLGIENAPQHYEDLEEGESLFLSSPDLEALADDAGRQVSSLSFADVWRQDGSTPPADSGLPLSQRYAYLEDTALELLAENAGWGLGDDLMPGQYILGEGVVSTGEADVTRKVLVHFPPLFDVSLLEGVLTCFGQACSHDADGHVNGGNYPLPEDFNCTGSHCRTSPEEGDEQGVGSYCFMSEDQEDYDEKYAAWQALLNEIANLPDGMKYTSDDELPDNLGTRENPAVIEIDSDSQLKKINGNRATSGIIVVKSGATLTLNGTAHHEGLIIVEPGAFITTGGGTYNLYGGIIDMEGNAVPEGVDSTTGNGNGKGNGNGGGSSALVNACGDDSLVAPGQAPPNDFAFSGNSRVNFSLEALLNLQRIERLEYGAIKSWREF